MMTLVWKEMGPSIGWEAYNSTELPVSFLLKWEQTAASHSHGQSFLPGQVMSSNCKSKPLLSCRVLSHSSKVSLTHPAILQWSPILQYSLTCSAIVHTRRGLTCFLMRLPHRNDAPTFPFCWRSGELNISYIRLIPSINFYLGNVQKGEQYIFFSDFVVQGFKTFLL